ncbi:MAG: hypothetical protein K2M91_09340 [Lachnospiraceae bacterium]|nr:hypothetical protein [Lachnospiraceae bacterium]
MKIEQEEVINSCNNFFFVYIFNQAQIDSITELKNIVQFVTYINANSVTAAVVALSTDTREKGRKSHELHSIGHSGYLCGCSSVHICIYILQSGYKIMLRDGKIEDGQQMVKTMNILRIKAALVGIFFPVTLSALAAVLAANKQE